ncbi:hypothetical protein M6B38_251230 [Iris pallida]|uniref:Uncharacterized protein n=1 Tax=Iris pallida TaxID=29817 RepID=A0AAX6IJN1_IRIPA|nr:hypothetical protein M6B38_251230 [Iris pallida]
MKREQEEIRTNSSPNWRRTATTRRKWWPVLQSSIRWRLIVVAVMLESRRGSGQRLYTEMVWRLFSTGNSRRRRSIWKKVEKVEQRSTRRQISGRASTVERRRG